MAKNSFSYLEGGTSRASRPAALIMAVGLSFAGLLIFIFDRNRIYDWVKVLHLLAIISWMVGLLYLPRLFAYHCDVEFRSDRHDLLALMEKRLLKVIMGPAMIFAWISGLYMAVSFDFFIETWFQIKFATIFLLTGFHVFLAKTVKQFALGIYNHSSRRWRILNEVSTICMIVAVIMVIIKPF